jgi:hypothetical protein
MKYLSCQYALVYDKSVKDFSGFICIIGAGPSGIFLAHELLSQGKKVLIVESGNFKSESALLNYSNYFFKTPSMLPKNVHRIGGGGNYWIGRIGEFIKLDFEKISGVRSQEWAFKKSELDLYYRRCYQSLLHTSTMDEEFIEEYFPLSKSLPEDLRIRPIRYIDPKIFTKLLQNDLKNPNLVVLTEHLCVEISENELTGCPILILQNNFGTDIKIMPRDVVIAGGTLQSTKLVIDSPKIMENLSKKVVGNYLMEHLEDYVGTLSISEKNLKYLVNLSLNKERKLTNDISKDFGVALGISESLSKKLSTINISLEIIHLRTTYKFDPIKYFEKSLVLKINIKVLFLIERVIRGSINRLVKWFNSKIFRKSKYSLWMKAEELPYYESELRVDSLKSNTLVYSHKVSLDTSNEVRKALKIIKNVVEKNNLGNIEYYPEILKSDSKLGLRPNWHPMGTLRIGNNKEGVVNENLLIHGTKHVYVLSPAVFPTGSNQNPVFTTLALALKLADQFA